MKRDDEMRIVVTGGAGFIGSAVVRHLVLETGAQVLTIDKLTYAGTRTCLKAADGHPNHRFVQADICDEIAVGRAVSEFRPERIIHLAAETHVDRSITGAKAFVETNAVGTFTLLEVARNYWLTLDAPARRAFRFLHVSTDEVYGSLGDAGFFTETTPYDPASPYAASKAASDHLVMAWHRTYGLPVVISNCSNNYGPYQFPEKLVPLVILNAMEGKPLPVYGAGTNVRDWLHVDDHARALDLIASRGRPGEKYNVGGRNERRNIDVVQRIAQVMDALRPDAAPHQRLITLVADRPGHDHRYAIDPSKIETELGWRARETFDAGIEKTVRWYLQNEWWWRPLRDRVYRGERLGTLQPAG
jgi:dTDP-glucose 4,6-dehydratase